MPKFILLLEDDENLVAHTEELLKGQEALSDYTIRSCDRIDLAKKFFEKNKDEICCIITDLNMNDEWLGVYKKESGGRFYSGWVWLQRFVYPEKSYVPTIIYSGYINFLENHLKEIGEYKKLNQSNIRCINKGGNVNEGFKALLKALNDLLNLQ